jgi:hypothetical protein
MFAQSNKWLWAAILVACLCVSWTARVAPAQGSDPYGECVRTWKQYTPPPVGGLISPPRWPNHYCTPTTCSVGCASMQVTTAQGPGYICVCNYIGPQPFCCTLAVLEGFPTPVAFGDCGNGYCPTGTNCVITHWYENFEDGSHYHHAAANCVGFQ